MWMIYFYIYVTSLLLLQNIYRFWFEAIQAIASIIVMGRWDSSTSFALTLVPPNSHVVSQNKTTLSKGTVQSFFLKMLSNFYESSVRHQKSS